jgi:hypothetical protein
VASDSEDLNARLERIRVLTNRLLTLKSQSVEAQELVERIRQELDAARVGQRIATKPAPNYGTR